MSYPCDDAPYGNYFSNPDVNYLDKPTGTDTEDNARVIIDNMVRAKVSFLRRNALCWIGHRAVPRNVAANKGRQYKWGLAGKHKCFTLE